MNSLRTLILGTIMVLAAWAAFHTPSESAAADKQKNLVHNVYFSLKDSSPAAKAKLVEACKKYLASDKHPGMQVLKVGVLAEELKRDVNDRDFDVCLGIIFTDKAAFDKYVVAPLHKQFVDENKDTFKKVRVFDFEADALIATKSATPASNDKPAEDTTLVHDVYFALKDSSPAAKTKLVEACKKYLVQGQVFVVGTLADELKGDLNDREFDVGLHIVFKDKAAHEKYQDDARHKQFIDENKDNWKKVRVFDSLTR